MPPAVSREMGGNGERAGRIDAAPTTCLLYTSETPAFDLTAYGLPDDMIAALWVPRLALDLPVYLGCLLYTSSEDTPGRASERWRGYLLYFSVWVLRIPCWVIGWG